jgi:hypothetical protein
MAMLSGERMEVGMGATAFAGSQLRASCSALDPKAAGKKFK